MEEVVGGMGALSVIVGSHDCTSQLTNIASPAALQENLHSPMPLFAAI
jgi:hypothetical protein